MTTGSIVLVKLALVILLGQVMTTWERIGVSDNLKLPEPFEWLTSTTIKGELESTIAYIYYRSDQWLVDPNEPLNTKEVRIILKAMEVAEATIKARNQPN